MLILHVRVRGRWVAPETSGRSVLVVLELQEPLPALPDPAQLRDRLRDRVQLRGRMLADAPAHQTPADVVAPLSTTVTLVAPVPGKTTVPQATPAQVRALYALARRKAVAVDDLAYHHFRVGQPADLTIVQASHLLTLLQAMADPILADDEDVESIPF